MHVHISLQTTFAIHSNLPRALSKSLPTYPAFFFPVSSVHCLGLQLLCLFRLTGGLALAPGFRIGNGVAENGVYNGSRRGLDHPRYRSPKYYSTMRAASLLPLKNKSASRSPVSPLQVFPVSQPSPVFPLFI